MVEYYSGINSTEASTPHSGLGATKPIAKDQQPGLLERSCSEQERSDTGSEFSGAEDRAEDGELKY